MRNSLFLIVATLAIAVNGVTLGTKTEAKTQQYGNPYTKEDAAEMTYKAAYKECDRLFKLAVLVPQYFVEPAAVIKATCMMVVAKALV